MQAPTPSSLPRDVREGRPVHTASGPAEGSGSVQLFPCTLSLFHTVAWVRG